MQWDTIWEENLEEGPESISVFLNIIKVFINQTIDNVFSESVVISLITMMELSPSNDDSREGRIAVTRVEMHRLAVLNGPTRMVQALRETRSTFSGLQPFQPPDICGLRDRLIQMHFVLGDPRNNMAGVVNTLMDAFFLDRRRCDQILSEWEVSS